MYQHIMVESGAKVFQKNNRLCIEKGVLHELPAEDIATVVLDNREIIITTYCLEQLSSRGTVVILCNGKHMPESVLLPYGANSRRLKTIRRQISQKKPHLKQLWRQVVQEKIRNQGRCLEFCGKENIVDKLVDKVKSGDTTNVESMAAAAYFPMLFGEDFTRRTPYLVNDILNYGYMILRSAIARYLAIYGFEPSLGLFHHSELNAFNLADDLLEPFRPLVDLYAFRFVESEEEYLTKEMRRELVQLLNCNIRSGKEIHSVNHAIEREVQSLSRCFEDASAVLLLPELMPLQAHAYE